MDDKPISNVLFMFSQHKLLSEIDIFWGFHEADASPAKSHLQDLHKYWLILFPQINPPYFVSKCFLLAHSIRSLLNSVTLGMTSRTFDNRQYDRQATAVKPIIHHGVQLSLQSIPRSDVKQSLVPPLREIINALFHLGGALSLLLASL